MATKPRTNKAKTASRGKRLSAGKKVKSVKTLVISPRDLATG